MAKLRVGDIVARKSYGMDVYFKVTGFKSAGSEKIVEIKGLSYRIKADAPLSDIVLVPETRLNEYREKEERIVSTRREQIRGRGKGAGRRGFLAMSRDISEGSFKRPGTVLHLDGDSDYLERCLEEYEKLSVTARGRYVPESEQPSRIVSLLKQYRPDILVLTGHDGVSKGEENYTDINSYRNSKYFIKAVSEAREYEPSMDALVIFAGACQSMYSSIINAGANYASSPQRVLIHTLDPVLVSEKVAFTEIDRVLSPRTVAGNTITGAKGIGGLQTKGKYRDGYPVEPYAAT